VGIFLGRRAEQESIRIRGKQLLSLFEIGTGNGVLVGVQLDDMFRKEVMDTLPILGYVGGKDVIEAAVFSDDHDDVLDRRGGLRIR